MPFPWKKNKVTRISQIVADLQSPKRGGSLVVETGFPTSLIDLFVKNRSRFKKPKAKKRVQLEISDPLPPTLPPAPPPPQELSNSSNRVNFYAESIFLEAPTSSRLVGETVHGDVGSADSDQDLIGVGQCLGGSDPNKVLAAILKMFMVLVLTLSVKKLTVGITMSAFVLLFLEYAGKRFVSFLKPCSNANMAFKSLAQRVSSCIWFQKSREGLEPALVHGKILVSELVAEVELSSASSSMEEIEIVETKNDSGNRCAETYFAGSELNSVNGDKNRVCPEMEEEDSKGKVEQECEISQCKSKGKRSAKFKSKMVKKLVPKKLRGSKKEKRSKESEVPSSVERDKSGRFVIEEEEKEQENGNRSPLLLPSKLESTKDDEVDYGITCSNESSLVREEIAMTVSNVQERIDRVGNSGYIILFLIALSGLVVGRFLALILTMTWFFMLKILKTPGRSLDQ